jgi:hypothetical protein
LQAQVAHWAKTDALTQQKIDAQATAAKTKLDTTGQRMVQTALKSMYQQVGGQLKPGKAGKGAAVTVRMGDGLVTPYSVRTVTLGPNDTPAAVAKRLDPVNGTVVATTGATGPGARMGRAAAMNLAVGILEQVGGQYITAPQARTWAAQYVSSFYTKPKKTP